MVRQRSAKPLFPSPNLGAASILICAGMAELADARDLKSLDPKDHTGSTPVLGTILAEIAQLVERHLAKVEVAGPSPVFRSRLWGRSSVGMSATLTR